MAAGRHLQACVSGNYSLDYGVSGRMHAGRPVFTAHGSEHALAGFMAIIDAVMSFAKDRGDGLRSMR
jgi:hypothetical protein